MRKLTHLEKYGGGGLVVFLCIPLWWSYCTDAGREASREFDLAQRREQLPSACFDYARGKIERLGLLRRRAFVVDAVVADLENNRYRVASKTRYPTGSDTGDRIEHVSVDCTVTIADGDLSLESLEIAPIEPVRREPSFEASVACFDFSRWRMEYPDLVEEIEPSRTVTNLGDGRYREQVHIWNHYFSSSLSQFHPYRALIDCTVIVAGDEPVTLERLSVAKETGQELNQRALAKHLSGEARKQQEALVEAELKRRQETRENRKVQSAEALEEDLMSAWARCQEFTEERLVSPASAKWPWDNRPYTSHLGAGRFRVQTHVDSQNAFGAMLRTPVGCVVQKKGTSWTLESLSME